MIYVGICCWIYEFLVMINVLRHFRITFIVFIGFKAYVKQIDCDLNSSMSFYIGWSMNLPWRYCNRQGKSEPSLTVRSRQGKFEPFLTAMQLTGQNFPDGGRKNIRETLSWRPQPSGNDLWRCTVRKGTLSLTFFCWRVTPDGYRHGKSFLTVLAIFPDGKGCHGKSCLG
jgi:hypothetical protein